MTFMLLGAFGSTSCITRPEAPATWTGRTLDGPPQTGDATAIGLHGRTVVASLQSKKDGTYEVWIADLAEGQWVRPSSQKFRLPIAVGTDGTGRVAVADAEVGRVRLWTLSGRRTSHVEIPGLPRTILPDGAGGWLLGGTFRLGGALHLACRVRADGEILPLKSTRMFDDRDGPGMDHAGLVRLGTELLVSSPMLSEIRAVLPLADTARKWADLVAALPEYRHSALGDPVPSLREPEAFEQWANERDIPSRLLGGDDGVHLAVLRRHLDAWSIVTFSAEGALEDTRAVPLAWVPIGWALDGLLVRRKDLETAGGSIRLQLVQPGPEVLIRASSPATGTPHRWRVITDREQCLDCDYPIVLIDPATCVGDVQSAFVQALTDGMIPQGPLTLAWLNARSAPLSTEGALRRIEREALVRPEVLDWRAVVPADATPVAAGIWIIEAR